MQPIQFKPGTTFEYIGSLTVDGELQDLTGATITTEVRTRGGAVAIACSVEIIPDELGNLTQFRVHADPAATAACPLGALLSDIIYAWPDGTVEATPTFPVEAVRRITQ